MGSIAPCHPLRSEAQADYQTFLRGYQVVFPGRATV